MKPPVTSLVVSPCQEVPNDFLTISRQPLQFVRIIPRSRGSGGNWMMTADVLSRLSAGQTLGAAISLTVIVLSVTVLAVTFISGWRDTRPPKR
jgi:hypothetical protein